jgi:hypothetical protein
MRLHEILARFSEIIRSYEMVEYEVAGTHQVGDEFHENSECRANHFGN